MEAELRAVDEMRAELAQVRLDIQKLGLARQELMGQVQGFTQDLARSAVDLQQVAALKAEIQEIRHETQHLRSGIEVEKKGYAESYEQGQEMQKKLISVASEVEKLRAEAEKRSRAAVSVGNQVYAGGYGNPKAAYAANPYNAGYSTNQANTADSGSQYGPGSTHAPWGAYDMQRASGRR
uniref:Protein FLX-like 1 n=2 Tax=Oryza brachyantha TaxID=4533 RepID=J3ML73_ORYBR